MKKKTTDKKEKKLKTVADYISAFPKDVQRKLKQLRSLIKKTAPQAEERISYGVPAYHFHERPLVYFAAFKNHIGFYATPTGHEKFEKDLEKYKTGKGSVQFPLDEPLPAELITKIIQFRAEENSEKAAEKKSKRNSK